MPSTIMAGFMATTHGSAGWRGRPQGRRTHARAGSASWKSYQASSAPVRPAPRRAPCGIAFKRYFLSQPDQAGFAERAAGLNPRRGHSAWLETGRTWQGCHATFRRGQTPSRRYKQEQRAYDVAAGCWRAFTRCPPRRFGFPPEFLDPFQVAPRGNHGRHPAMVGQTLGLCPRSSIALSGATGFLALRPSPDPLGEPCNCAGPMERPQEGAA